MFSKRILKVILFSIAILATSCTIKNQEHGYDLEHEEFKKLKIHSTTKQEVRSVLGSPSAVSGIDQNKWYYISLQTKSVAVLRPKVKTYKVIELHFKNNTISNIIAYNSNEIKKLDFNKWESPVRGSESGVFKDFLYNLGRFNKKPSSR